MDLIIVQGYMWIFGAMDGGNNMIDHMKIMERYASNLLDPAWDNKILNYDKNKFDWNSIFLSAVQEKFPSVDKLENLHLHVTTHQLIDVRKLLERLTTGNEFAKRVDEFYEEYINPLLPSDDYMLQKTPGIRLVVPDQEKKGRRLIFHTGYWTGYNNGMYTVWTPVTRAWDSNAMQVLNWDDTVKTMEQIHSGRVSVDKMHELCEKLCWPTNIDVGQAWLFNQGHLHGNINNDTGVTRVSFDTRAMVRGTDYGVRYPGGFFRLRNQPKTFEIKNLDASKRWIVFVDQGSDYVGKTPQFVIREFLMGWCKQHNIVPVEWVNEFLMHDWMISLRYHLTNGITEGIVFPSIHAFSADPKQRFEIMQLAIDHNVPLVFVDEGIVLDSVDALEHVKQIYRFAHPEIEF